MLVLKKISQSGSVTLMLDIWSSKRMCGYIGFSLEGVTINYEQFNAFISLRQMTGCHTGEAILAEFEDVLKEWDLNIKTVPSTFIFKKKFPLNSLYSLHYLGCSSGDRQRIQHDPGL